MSNVVINGVSLNNDDKQVLQTALNLYIRFLMGQFTFLSEHLKIVYSDSKQLNIDLLKLPIVCDTLEECQGLLKESWDIMNPQVPQQTRLACRVEKLLEGDTEAADMLQEVISKRFREISQMENP